jgi:hypothetical protein
MFRIPAGELTAGGKFRHPVVTGMVDPFLIGKSALLAGKDSASFARMVANRR